MFPREAMALVGNTSWSVIYAAPDPDQNYVSGFTPWTKPRGATFAYFLIIGPGSGGGSAFNGVSTVASGGGASGAVYSFLVPTIMIPDTIWVRPGIGGAGATSGSAGLSGDPTFILLSPDGNTSDSLFYLSSGSGGAGQSSSAGGTAANSGSWCYSLGVGLIVNSPFLGQNGANGATSSNGAGSSPSWGGGGIMINGGAGGGNGTGAGGTINTGSLDIPLISGGSGTTGGNGANGFGYGQRIAFTQNTPNPLPILSFTGGAGGGGHTNGQAGRGGNGGYGCGGGGGGSCTLSGGLSGRGGNGGDGLVIIGAF